MKVEVSHYGLQTGHPHGNGARVEVVFRFRSDDGTGRLSADDSLSIKQMMRALEQTLDGQWPFSP